MLENIEIIAGTYEEFILGYQVRRNDDNKWSLMQTFANHDHFSSIRCVACNGTMLVSGGADETIRVYDMTERKVSEILMEHKGTVNCVEITPDGCHLITGGEDGMLAVFEIGSYRLEKIWKLCHKDSGIVGISVHPSGKMALTVGADATLRTWNLVSGRRVYVTTLGRKKELGWQIIGVQWSPSGNLYAVGMRNKIDLYSVDLAGVVWSLPSEVKINCYLFLNDNLIVVGYENGKLIVYDIEERKCIIEKQVHQQRVKSISSVIENEKIFIASASSTGEIILWQFFENNLIRLASEKCGCRITCLTINSCGIPGVTVKKDDDEHLADEQNLEDLADYFIEIEKNTEGNAFVTETLLIEKESDNLSPGRKVRRRKKNAKNKLTKTHCTSTSNTSKSSKSKLSKDMEGNKKSELKRENENSASKMEPKSKKLRKVKGKKKAMNKKKECALNMWKERVKNLKMEKKKKKKVSWDVTNIT